MPFVEPKSRAITPLSVMDLQVFAGDAGVVNHNVAARAATQNRLVFGEQVLVVVDFEHRAVLGLLVSGDRYGVALHGFGRELEVAFGQLQVLFENNDDRAHKCIVLALRVLREIVGQLIGHGLGTPAFDAVEIGCAQFETVLVRRHGAVSADRHGLGVDFALKRAGEIDGLQVFGAELREHSVDRTLHAFLKTIKNAHSYPFYPYLSYAYISTV